MTDQKRGPGRPGKIVDPETYSTIAKNIDRRMKEIGMKTNVELSEKSGVSRTVITNIFMMPNKSVMGDSAVKLAKALQCRVEWLITGEGPVTDDEITSVPILSLRDLSETEINTAIESARSISSSPKMPCPSGYSVSSFGVQLDSTHNFDSCKKYNKFEQGGVMFFDHEAPLHNGGLILIQLSAGSTPEIMEFFKARDMGFVRSLNDNLPESIRTVEMTQDMKVLAVHIGYSVIPIH